MAVLRLSEEIKAANAMHGVMLAHRGGKQPHASAAVRDASDNELASRRKARERAARRAAKKKAAAKKAVG